MQIGEILADLRKDRGIKQKQLAELLHVSNSTLSAYEIGVHEPSLDFLVKCAHFFNVSTDYLLGLTSEPRCFSAPEKEFYNGVTNAQMIEKLQKLLPEQRAALLCTLDAMIFCAENKDYSTRNGETVK